MPVMVIMTGIQASGKSTFCREYLSAYDRINLDTLHTRNKENIAIDKAFCEKRDMVIDNTNPTVEDRKKYIQKARKNGYKVIGYFMQSRLQACISRNGLREGREKVPVRAIAATSNKLEIPSYDEGVDELYYVSVTDVGMTVEKWRDSKTTPPMAYEKE